MNQANISSFNCVNLASLFVVYLSKCLVDIDCCWASISGKIVCLPTSSIYPNYLLKYIIYTRCYLIGTTSEADVLLFKDQ